MMPDGFSFAEALQPAQPKGFSFAEALAPPAPDPLADSEGHLIDNPDEALKRGGALVQSAWGRLSGTDRPPADTGDAVDTVDTRDTIAPGLRSALAPAANTTYGSILPFARDQGTGDVRLALPSSLRDLATGGLDLLEGPTTGTVTPAATSLLANAAIGGGLTPSLARGTGAAIRDTAELGAPAADLYRPRITATEVQARDGVGIMEAWNRAHAENNAAAIAKIGQATDIDGAIAAAGKAAEAPSASTLGDLIAPSADTAAPTIPSGWTVDDRFGPTPGPDAPAEASPYVPITSSQVQRRDGVGAIEAGRRADAENAANAPVPQSAGAAASREGTLPGSWELTPKQTAAYRSTAEGKKLLESQEPGVPDYNEYVRGVIANTAEQEQTVNTARELKSLNITAPEVGQEARDIRFANNEKRISHLSDTIKSPVDVANAVEDLRLQDETQLADVWQNKEDADAQPMLDAASRITTSPDGRRPLVRRVVSSVLKELYDENGELLTDPEQLYGVRKHIDDLMDEQHAGGGKKNARAMSALIKLKNTLDNEVIEPAADGFGQYLSDHADAAQKIDEMKVLQGHEAKLFDAQNYLTYNRFQTMMRQIVDSRQARGLNDYKSITPETMARLWALRDDLRRSASAIELARTTGSDSAQNLWDMVKGAAAGHIGTAAASGVGMLIGGPIGAGIGGTLKLVGSSLASGRTARIQTARGMEMLNPPRTLTPPSPD